MKTKTIIIHEGCDWLYINGNNQKSINHEQYRKLQVYLQEVYGSLNMLLIGIDRIMFKNYVGFISLNDVYIEILPKISLCSEVEAERTRLLEMLAKCDELPVKLDYNNQDMLKNHTLLGFIAKLFITELEAQLSKGIHREYRSYSENSPILKGKILVTDHIRKNHSNRNQVFCKRDEFDENNLLNMLFKAVLNILSINALCSDLIPEIRKFIGYLADVADIYVYRELIDRITLNRQSIRYEKALALAKLILFKLHSKNRHGRDKSFSILFEMNTLYEKYIALLVQRIGYQEGFAVRAQDKSKHLLHNRTTKNNEISLKPDIVVEKGDSITIIDTKWKIIQKGNSLYYAISDIYQMYAYLTSYSNAHRCILLYPKTGSVTEYPSWDLMPPYSSKSILIKDIRLDTENNTVADLKALGV